MNPDITPRSYQLPAIAHHIDVLTRHKATLEASETGFGKMYVTCFVAREMGKPLFVVAPKSVLPQWREVASDIGVPLICAINYELLRTGKTPFGRWASRANFEYHVDPEAIIVFDEVHNCKGLGNRCKGTLNARLLVSTVPLPNRVMCISATAATSAMDMKFLGYRLGLFDLPDFYQFALRHGCRVGSFGLEPCPRKSVDGMTEVNKMIFPHHGYRCRLADIPDFPKNSVTFIPAEVTSEDIAEIQTHLDEVEAKRKEDVSISIVALLRARQEIELKKVPGFIRNAVDLVSEGKSVPIFVNFTKSLALIVDGLRSQGIDAGYIDGSVPEKTRKTLIDRFQRNELPVLVLNARAGGVGISLHDLNGRPRVSIISPDFSASVFVQCLGRIHRSGALSPAVQQVIYLPGTAEDRVRKAVMTKLGNLSSLNDGDLSLFDNFTCNEDPDLINRMSSRPKLPVNSGVVFPKTLSDDLGITGEWAEFFED